MTLIRGPHPQVWLWLCVFVLLAWQHAMPVAMPGHALCPCQLGMISPLGGTACLGVHARLFMDTAAQFEARSAVPPAS